MLSAVGNDCVEQVGTASDRYHRCSSLGKHLRRFGTDTRRCSGDEDNLAGKCLGHLPHAGCTNPYTVRTLRHKQCLSLPCSQYTVGRDLFRARNSPTPLPQCDSDSPVNESKISSPAALPRPPRCPRLTCPCATWAHRHEQLTHGPEHSFGSRMPIVGRLGGSAHPSYRGMTLRDLRVGGWPPLNFQAPQTTRSQIALTRFCLEQASNAASFARQSQ